MLATFQVKNSLIKLNGVDISGLSNTVEVTISAKTNHQPTSRLNGKVYVAVIQKAFLKETDIDDFVNMCQHSHGADYCFTRECLEYTIKNVRLAIEKEESIAGVIPVKLSISGNDLPIRKRIN